MSTSFLLAAIRKTTIYSMRYFGYSNVPDDVKKMQASSTICENEDKSKHRANCYSKVAGDIKIESSSTICENEDNFGQRASKVVDDVKMESSSTICDSKDKSRQRSKGYPKVTDDIQSSSSTIRESKDKSNQHMSSHKPKKGQKRKHRKNRRRH